MDLNLRDKVVFVTGGSKGIGKAIARAFYEEGAKVAVSARGGADLEAAAAEMKGLLTIQADLMQEEERKKAIEVIRKTWGGVDILINNVGGSNGASIIETEVELFESAIAVNFYTAVSLSKAVIPYMKEKGEGCIINMSSIYGRESGGKPTYNAAKAALISFTKSLADEVIPFGIRVNGVAPGAILHPSGNWQKRLEADPEKIKQFIRDEIPAGRFGTPEEIASVVVFLASSKASWVVGATLNVDGGQSRSF